MPVSIPMLKPVDPDGPPEGLVQPGNVRGIVIYRRPAPSQPVKRRRGESFQLPLPAWQAQRVEFQESSAIASKAERRR